MKNIRFSNWLVPALAAAGLTAMIMTVTAGDKSYPVSAPLAVTDVAVHIEPALD